MWTLPGYGDYLEQRDPDLRKRMAETRRPDGFEDVVAAMQPIADDQPDVPRALERDVRGRRCRRDGRRRPRSWAAG